MVRIQMAALLILAACADSDTRGYVVDTSATGVVTVSNTTPSDWSDSTDQWRIVQIANLEASDDDSTGAIISPWHTTLDGAGRLVVVEQVPLSLRLLELDGTLIRTIGREGDGPGEYRSPAPIAFGRYIVVDDPRAARLTVYDTSGALLNTWPAPCCFYAPITRDDSNRVYVRTSSGDDSTASSAFVRISVTSGAADTVHLKRIGPEQEYWVFMDGSMRQGIPFQPSDVTGFTPEGHILRGWSGAYEFVKRTFGGDTIRVVRRSWQPVERADSLRRARFDQVRKRMVEQFDEGTVNQVMSFSDIPAEAEPMPGLIADGAGNVWIPIYAPDATTRQFDVFSPEGIWRGTIHTPWALDEYPEWVGDDKVVTQGTTDEGYPYIRVWRVEK